MNFIKRWKIERLFAWLHKFQRLVVRWEHQARYYLALLQCDPQSSFSDICQMAYKQVRT
jgi:hypothetical protein